jgi:predicted Ser/Thr protein kinase
MAIRDDLRQLGDEIRDDFVQNRRVMSFAEYLELATARPHLQLRSAPQYIRDCFDFFGVEMLQFPWGQIRRFKLFDCEWAGGRDRLVGQEEVQNRIYRALTNFVNEGVSNKLALLHGPNGSAKSTLVRCIGRALQNYSTRDDGALYRINWIFPGQKISRSGIGFSGSKFDEHGAGDSYAYLPDELIDAKLADELRDHPIFLIPPDRRAPLMDRMLAEAPLGEGNGRGNGSSASVAHGEEDGPDDGKPDDGAAAQKRANFVLSDYLRHGRLSHKNRTIYEALLASYQGDYFKVLRHVQVERFYVGHRYREGYATVEPQLSVDAIERQVSADRSVAALPAALQSIALYEYGGELVNANRGLIEYQDLLKRPLEAYKYLLTTVERSSVSLQTATLFLDLVFIGSSNEIHLQAFKEIPEFQSFRGRLELVRVPYLLDFKQEEKIYSEKLREAAHSRHVAPHSAYVAALWAVLTRMRKPMADKFPKKIADLVARLTPLEKAELYALGKAPDALSTAQARDLTANLRAILRESDSYPNYEGRTGASPRELQVVIFNAANSPAYSYISPVAVLEEIEELCKQSSVYEFLKQEPLPGGFHDHKKFIELCRERLIDRIDDEVRSSMGLVEEGEYERLFQRYVNHVTHWIRHEKVRNANTGRMENPDEAMMREMEKTLEVSGRADDFRADLIAKVGAWSLDHLNQKPDYGQIFPDYFKRIREAYFEERKKTVQSGVAELLRLVTGNEGVLSAEARKRARSTLENLIGRFAYSEASARDAVSLLARNRYPG